MQTTATQTSNQYKSASPTSSSTTIHVAASKRNLGNVEFELRQENIRLDKLIYKEAPQKDIEATLEKIDRLFNEMTDIHHELEKSIRFWKLSPRQWSWIRDGVCGVGVIAGIFALGAAIVTAKFVNTNCTQIEPIVTTNTVVCGANLLYGIVAGLYWLVDNRKNEAFDAQKTELEEAKLKSEYWRTSYIPLRDINVENKLMVDENSVSKKFNDGIIKIKEIKNTNQTDTPDYLASMLAQVHPTDEKLKDLFRQQQQIVEQIQQFEKENPISKNTIIDSGDHSDSIKGDSFLNTEKADKLTLSGNNTSFRANKEELLQQSRSNFNALSQVTNYNFSKMYIRKGENQPPFVLASPNYEDEETKKINI